MSVCPGVCRGPRGTRAMLLNDPAADPEPRNVLYTPEGWNMRPRARLLGSRPAAAALPLGDSGQVT